jgi:bacterial/archaeal transporter family protein
MSPVLFAVAAAVAFGFWTVFHKLASSYIDQVFGAIVVSFVAVLAGAIVLLPRLKETHLVSNPKGIYFLILAGLCAFAIDYFVLKAYSGGLPITVGGPIVIGGSIAVAVFIGFFLGDSITFVKILGLVLLIAGASILSTSV